MFDFDLGDIFDSIGDVASSAVDTVGDTLSSIGDWGSSTLDSIEDWGSDLWGDLTDFELSSLLGGDSPELEYSNVVEPSASNFLEVSSRESPDTISDLTEGLDVNPVATESAWKSILSSPTAEISPGDYSLASPTLLDKIVASGNENVIPSSDYSPTPDWFNSGRSLPSEWTSSFDPYGGLPQESSYADLATKAGGQGSKNWLQKLIERPVTNAAKGTLGKSPLTNILNTLKAGSQIYGALSKNNSNTAQRGNLKASISQLPTKKMAWKAPKAMAQGGSTGRGALCNCGRQGLLRHDTPGQEDVIPIAAAGGEYVFDADTVSALGDGNTEAGAKKLDLMRQNIRRHKRSAPATKIPPKARPLEQYLRGAK